MKNRIRMNKSVLAFTLGLVVVGLFSFVFYFKRDAFKSTESNKIKVVASFYPLAEFTSRIGGDFVEVINITPAGSEPHDYEPTAKDILNIESANLLVFNGNGFETWGDNVIENLEGKNIKVIMISDYMSSLKLPSEESKEEVLDPHFWLDPVNSEKIVEVIKDALIEIDPKNASVYEVNANEYKKELMALDDDYREGLASCELNEIVVSHEAFGYLAQRYNLKTHFIAGISPDEEPSPSRLAEVVDIAKKKNIKYIFFETLISPKLAETIASEIGAQTLVLNPIEGLTDEEINSGMSYITVMEDNLNNLRTALSCR